MPLDGVLGKCYNTNHVHLPNGYHMARLPSSRLRTPRPKREWSAVWPPSARCGYDVETDLRKLADMHNRNGRPDAVITVSGQDWDLLRASQSDFLAGYVGGHRLQVQRADPFRGIKPVGGGR
jgi:hypothetical protein